ncbi:hypothetical protein C1646_664682 [Rhizophagus diaphanus]|nr:hypothetical protein C1646_664682 [Rhizophagus diaphanus] [Rhizophagus sp. MUCL 43196]
MNSFTENVSNHEILELSEYEAFDTQLQTNNFDTNETPRVNLQNGLLFPNFDIAYYYCLEFGRFSGFAVRKKRIEKNSGGSIRSRCMDCEFSEKTPNNSNHINIRNKGSKKTECPWHINLLQPLNSNFVKIIKFVNKHNHKLLEDNVIFGIEFRELSDEIKENIQYFIFCDVTDLPTIRNLLKGKFSDQFILRKIF